MQLHPEKIACFLPALFMAGNALELLHGCGNAQSLPDRAIAGNGYRYSFQTGLAAGSGSFLAGKRS
jgi:hypothetical protein